MGYSKYLLIHLKWSFNAIIFSFWDFFVGGDVSGRAVAL